MEWLPITHSTPETCALSITVGDSRIVHTADWKIDADPVVGAAWSARRFQELGDAGIDAVICDSTNALQAGRSPSEGEVAVGLGRAVAACQGRVVVGCFSSNVARMRTLAKIGVQTGRYLGVLGRSASGMARCAQQVGLLPPEFRPIHAEHLGYLPPSEVLAVATGSQGEWGAALHRLMTQTHPDLSLDAGDTVILSSKTIPGNEESVSKLQQAFKARGVEVVHGDDYPGIIHASGHPCAGELDAMYRWLKAPVAIPVHGEQRHMAANAAIARSAGVRLPLTGENGDLFYLAPEPGIRRRAAEVGRLEVAPDGSLRPAR